MSLVSIVIPFRNLFQELENCIAGILNQVIEFEFEIVVLDSSDISFEKTIMNLSDQITYIRIDPNAFNHGLTRQFAVQHCKGKYIVFSVQDAVPADNKWLDHLIKPMNEYNLDAICGQQIVPHDKSKNPVQWFRPVDEQKLRFINISYEDYIKKSPLDRRMIVGWDNVNACYTKEVLERLPFADLNFGEDAFWADQALKNGCKIAFTGHAQVHHYHHYDNIQDVVRRVIAEYLVLKKVYDLDPMPFIINLREMISIVKLILMLNINILDKLYWLKYNFKIQWAYYHGYRIWCGYSSISNAEDFVNQKVPQSTTNVRK